MKNDCINLIFTFVPAFDMPEDIAFLNRLKNMFEESGGNLYFVELEAELETRLERNNTPHRLEEKKCKRDVEWSKNELLETMKKYRLNSNEGEVNFENYIKINNTKLLPEEVADMVIKKFKLNR